MIQQFLYANSSCSSCENYCKDESVILKISVQSVKSYVPLSFYESSKLRVLYIVVKVPSRGCRYIVPVVVFYCVHCRLSRETAQGALRVTLLEEQYASKLYCVTT